MLFVLWNVAHYSIIAVAFIRNGFYFIYYIVFIYSNDARASFVLWRVRATASGFAGVRSVRAWPSKKPARNNSDRTKIFLYYKKTPFYCILLKMLYICTKHCLLCLLQMTLKKRKTLYVFVFVCLLAFLFCAFLFGLLPL